LFARFLKIGLYMILMGVLTGWMLVYAVPVAITWEIAESTANRLPVYGFFVGMAVGLGMGLSASIKQSVLAVLGIVAFGGVLWFFSLMIVGGALFLIGMSEDAVDRITDWVGPAAFFLGILLGGIGILAVMHDKLAVLLARFRSKRHEDPR